MTILTEKEIESLKRIHPKKRILRLFFLFSGIFVLILGVIFLILGFDFGLHLFDLNFSFLLDLIIIIIGMILISKFFIASYHLRENSIVIKKANELREPVNNVVRFTSISLSRLIAAIILSIAGLLSLSIFGTDFGHEVPYGSAVFLGGPSWFYVTGLPALAFGIGLIFYFFLSSFRGIFSRSDNFYFFYEIRPGFPWLTEIPHKDIEMIKFQNNHLGPKYTWIPVFYPFIIMQLMTSLSLFSAERAAPEFILSRTFLIISIMEIVALIILIFFQQKFFELATDSRLYEMWFSPIRFKTRSTFNDEFSEFLGFENEKKENNFFKEISKKHKKYFNFSLGSLLIFLSLVILINMVFFGPYFWWFSLIYGSILLTKSISKDFSNEDSFNYDQIARKFVFKRRFFNKFEKYLAKGIDNLEIKKWFRKLDTFDVIFILGLVFFSSIQQGFGWGLADTNSLIFDNILSTTIYFVLILIFFLYICLPINVIEVKTKSITYHIPITIRGNKQVKLKRKINNLMGSLKLTLSEEMRKTFYLRFGILIIIILGVAIYLLLYFSFFF